jgi:3-oxoacyl-[acyl-carrier protein] reductase
MSDSYAGKVALVTGGGRGMGRAIAEAFAAAGAAVVIGARTRSYGEEAVAAIRQRGGRAALAVADNSDRAAMKAMVETAAEAFGQLDIVVHCAADSAHQPVVDMADDTFDYLVRSNIHSLFWLAKDAAPHLARARDKGRLIYISSGSANRNYIPGLICYAATKAFMNAFARGLAMEFGKLGILVNVVEPGMIASDRLLATISEEAAAAMASAFPVPRVGTPEEVAAAVLFLASNAAGYITGSSLLVDGGASMAPMPSLERHLSE